MGGFTKNMIINDLHRKESVKKYNVLIFLVILFSCIASSSVIGLLIWKKRFSSLKAQTIINKTPELDLLKNLSLTSLDVLRHLDNDPMEIKADKITIYNEIGVGEFGLVKRGVVMTDTGLKLDVAIKMLKSNFCKSFFCIFIMMINIFYFKII